MIMSSDSQATTVRKYRDMALSLAKDKLTLADYDDYTLDDWWLDECLRRMYGIESKQAGRPPYEDWIMTIDLKHDGE